MCHRTKVFATQSQDEHCRRAGEAEDEDEDDLQRGRASSFFTSVVKEHGTEKEPFRVRDLRREIRIDSRMLTASVIEL